MIIRSLLVISILFNIVLGALLLGRGTSEPRFALVASNVDERDPPVGPRERRLNDDDSITEIHVQPPVSLSSEEVDNKRLTSMEVLGGYQEFLTEVEELGMRLVPADLLKHTSIRALDPRARLSPQIQELFSLGTEETTRLNAALQEVAEAFRNLELQKMEVVELSEHQALVRIPPLARDAQALEEHLRQAVELELGDFDGRLLWDIMTSGQNRSFWQDFGASGVEFTITMSREESGVDLAFQRRLLSSPPQTGSGVSLPQRMAISAVGISGAEARSELQRHLGRQAFIIESLPGNLQSLLHQEAER